MSDLPLSGVRIIEFTWIGVGPYCALLCALMGAECIRIETTTRPIYYRGTGSPMARVSQSGQTMNTLNELNVNRRSVCIDLKHKEGVELVKKLVAVSDVVAENFQTGVMDRLGLGYSQLKSVNPALIMLLYVLPRRFRPREGRERSRRRLRCAGRRQLPERLRGRPPCRASSLGGLDFGHDGLFRPAERHPPSEEDGRLERG